MKKRLDKTSAFSRSTPWLFLAAAALMLLAGCGERPPIEAVQHGYRGTGMDQIYNPRILASQAALNEAPEALPQVPADGPKARDVYKNVQVLGDLSVAQFTRNMTAITNWVSPDQGCAYCHNLANLADDSKYAKVVARRMLQMTQHVNADWQKHVGQTGVTCYTCHRGQPVPTQAWYAQPPERTATRGMVGYRGEQNLASPQVGLTSLPEDPFSAMLLKADEIRVVGPTALPTGNRQSTKQAEWTYGLMMHMSSSLGVNCTYCHNSRSFQTWDTSTPQRTTAWYGIRMARDLNQNYVVPLTDQIPAAHKGPTGDIGKVGCGTCHQGAYKPLYGAQMAKDYPELLTLSGGAVAPTAPVTSGLPPPVAEPKFALMYFATGSSTLQAPQAQSMTQLIDAMKADANLKATISGFHSASGGADLNAELAKQRAFTVRDSLLGAGIATERVALAKPVEMQANGGGEDPSARRVEVKVQ
ncbi:MAG TPA: photosynthetic reaction center cytochrome PufC [Methylibium sp.]|uniref:photosynthetic reaction center cytochrome PufC n=1 Tax=Methylibium sp. TaxID=2067992 RepID=UPI002DBA929C|nr:photosynthetic reaction center cytochrome PufC [Methylibium sp.]HEU4457708.1 photosynthetic reaction center cytochrome PufC [Methylibium sp.]